METATRKKMMTIAMTSKKRKTMKKMIAKRKMNVMKNMAMVVPK